MTPEERAVVDRHYEAWMKDQTKQYPHEDIKNTAKRLWSNLGLKEPEITICDSIQAAQLFAQKNFPTGFDQVHHCWWWSSWAAWYEACREIRNIEVNDTYLLFLDVCRHLPSLIPIDVHMVIVSRPIEIHTEKNENVNSSNRFLHNDSGLAVKFKDGTGIWAIEGVEVDEQIVMSPETLSIDQINKTNNEEVRRIMIERLGWDKYAECCDTIDERHNDMYAQDEELIKTPDNRHRLLCTDPSTNRKYSLGIPRNIETTEQAQNWMSHGFEKYACHRT